MAKWSQERGQTKSDSNMTGCVRLNALVVGGSGFAKAWLLICLYSSRQCCTSASEGPLGWVYEESHVSLPKTPSAHSADLLMSACPNPNPNTNTNPKPNALAGNRWVGRDASWRQPRSRLKLWVSALATAAHPWRGARLRAIQT